MPDKSIRPLEITTVTTVISFVFKVPVLSVPITEADIPNVYVSVMLVKGLTGGFDPKDSGDPGKPAFRVGYVEPDRDRGSDLLRQGLERGEASRAENYGRAFPGECQSDGAADAAAGAGDKGLLSL